MRVAVASGGSPDYLIDIVADGMVRLLGRGRVHLQFNRWTPTHPIFSQLLAFGPDNLSIYDCDVLVASRRFSPSAVRDYQRKTGGRVAILDGEDCAPLHRRFLHLADVYFLREFLVGESYPLKVQPLAFAAIPETLVRGQRRDIPVLFGGTEHSSTDRPPVVVALARAGWCTWETASRRVTPHDEYMRRLVRARIGVNVRGRGWQTYRYWETPWAGALLLSQRHSVVIEDDFVDGREAVFFTTPGEAVRRAKWLLKERTLCSEIAQAGLQAAVSRHLSTHRAARVLDAVT